MKRYYIQYGGFYNVYSLFWADKDSIEEKMLITAGYERITRKQAIKVCVGENYRRKHDLYFAYYSNNVILPYGYEMIKDKTDTYIISKTCCRNCLKELIYEYGLTHEK